MAARKRPADPLKVHTDGRHRLLTIHQGTRLTPTIVAVLSQLAEAAEDQTAEMHPNVAPTAYARRQTLEEVAPRLIARADGLALYVTDRRLG